METLLTLLFILIIVGGLCLFALPFIIRDLEAVILYPVALFMVTIPFFGVVKDEFEWNEYEITNRSMNEITGIITVEFNGRSEEFNSFKDVEHYKNSDTIKERKEAEVNSFGYTWGTKSTYYK